MISFFAISSDRSGLLPWAKRNKTKICFNNGLLRWQEQAIIICLHMYFLVRILYTVEHAIFQGIKVKCGLLSEKSLCNFLRRPHLTIECSTNLWLSVSYLWKWQRNSRNCGFGLRASRFRWHHHHSSKIIKIQLVHHSIELNREKRKRKLLTSFCPRRSSKRLAKYVHVSYRGTFSVTLAYHVKTWIKKMSVSLRTNVPSLLSVIVIFHKCLALPHVLAARVYPSGIDHLLGFFLLAPIARRLISQSFHAVILNVGYVFKLTIKDLMVGIFNGDCISIGSDLFKCYIRYICAVSISIFKRHYRPSQII